MDRFGDEFCRCRLGHFIPGIEQFDGEFFGLSEMEQRGMVPWLKKWDPIGTHDSFPLGI